MNGLLHARTTWRLAAATMLGAIFTSGAAPAADSPSKISREEVVNRALNYLQSQGQAEDGSYSAAAGPAITALVTTGVLRNGRPADDPLVAKSLKYLEGFVQPDGGVYRVGSNYRNYETCLAIVCLKEANADGRYDKIIAGADKFVRREQWDEAEGKDKDSVYYGGAGYGKSERPDLSNTSFLVEALKASGAPEDDAALQKALVFVSRCQNLESEYNTTEFAAKNPDGGFYYTPAAGGSSQAGKTDAGGLRSYASMTYAGLKSMIYAGVTADDPRVKAAVEWIGQHYVLSSNPGMGDAGLYYYYQTFAKALAALGQDEFIDEAGTKHNWREELVAALAARQRPDGAWANENSRWLEGDPNLTTGYALLALSYCK